MIKKIYRLEHKDGSGPFFYPNGVAKFDSSIKFSDQGLYAFSDICRFQEPSYIEFFQSDDYILYEIIVDKVISEHNCQVIFDPKDILSKTIINKNEVSVI